MKEKTNLVEGQSIRSLWKLLLVNIILALSIPTLSGCGKQQPANNARLQTMVAATFAASTSNPNKNLTTPYPEATGTQAHESLPLPTSAACGTPVVVDPTMTEANPLTDRERIIHYLVGFYEQNLCQFSQPGWYLAYRQPIGTEDSIQERFWLHISDTQFRCDQELMALHKQGSLDEVRYFDSRVSGQAFFIGWNTRQTWQSDLGDQPCIFQSSEGYGNLGTELFYRETNVLHLKTWWEVLGESMRQKLSAWFTEENGKQYFIYDERETGIPGASVGVPGQPGEVIYIDGKSKIYTVDLETGATVKSTFSYLPTGGDWQTSSYLHGLEYYDELPAEDQAALDMALEANGRK